MYSRISSIIQRYSFETFCLHCWLQFVTSIIRCTLRYSNNIFEKKDCRCSFIHSSQDPTLVRSSARPISSRIASCNAPVATVLKEVRKWNLWYIFFFKPCGYVRYFQINTEKLMLYFVFLENISSSSSSSSKSTFLSYEPSRCTVVRSLIFLIRGTNQQKKRLKPSWGQFLGAPPFKGHC